MKKFYKQMLVRELKILTSLKLAKKLPFFSLLLTFLNKEKSEARLASQRRKHFFCFSTGPI